jgi:hypothetical protein
MKKRFPQTGISTTKNEASPSKLKLSRETLRCLGAPELAQVVGGDTHDTCFPTCVDTRP